MNSGIYEGLVSHRRFSPAQHEFRYRVFMMYLDLDELPGLFDGRWLWSSDRFNLAWFRRSDHYGDPAVSLAEAIRDLVEQRTGVRPAGPIRLLTHLCYFGYCFNPVSFYYCFDAADRHLDTIVAEVHNTPWGERHCYVLNGSRSPARSGRRRFRFGKAFHVSPFMDMDFQYDWRFTEPGAKLTVHMDNLKAGTKIFDATMALTRRGLSPGSLAFMLARYPFMTARIIAAIYWQALRLWWKRCPLYPHPAKMKEGPPAAAGKSCP